MAERGLHTVLEHARRRATLDAAADLSDRDLLERFVQSRDDAAFAALVQRHAAMVLGVCRRVLKHGQDAEDASQATFLVLARNAASIRQRTALASWLYGVAYRNARKLRIAQARRDTREARARTARCRDLTPDTSWREVQAALDEALMALPEKYRAPMVLCYLEARTRDEAANQLGLTLSTLRGRLELGRGLLRCQLAGRGITLSGALLLATLTECTGKAAVSGTFATAAVHAALGRGTASAAVQLLADGATGSVLSGKIVIALTLFAIMSFGVGAAVISQRIDWNDQSAPPTELAAAEEAQPQPVERPEHRDLYGDSLPPEAVARLGTIRFRPGGTVMSIAFTPDGKELFAYGRWEGVTMWDPASGKELSRFVPEGNWLGDALLTPDGQSLITIESGDHKYPIRVRNRADLKLTREIPDAQVHSLSLTPDGKRVLGMRNDRNERTSVIIWDLESGKEIRSWKAHDGVALMALSRDGTTLATATTLAGADDSNAIRVWDVDSGKLIREFTGLAQPVNRLAVSPDGKHVASVELHIAKRGASSVFQSDNRIHVWDVNSGNEVAGLLDPAGGTSSDSTQGSNDLLYSADGKQLVSVTIDGILRVWDAHTAKQQRQYPLGYASVGALAFSPDGQTLAVGGAAIRLFDWATGKEKQPRQGHLFQVFGLAVTPDGRTVATGAEGPIQLWDAATGRPLQRLEGHGKNIHTLQMLRDGRTMLSTGSDQIVRFWDLDTGKERQRIDVTNMRWPIAFSHDGAIVACVHDDGSIRLVETATGKERQRVPGSDDPDAPPSGAAFTPDGRSLVVLTGDVTHVWDLATGKEVRRFTFAEAGPALIPSPMRQTGRAVTSRDGRFIAYGSPRGSLAIHEVATGKLVRLIEQLLPGDRANWFGFSPDGRCVAWSVWPQPAIHVLEVASGEERLRLDGHKGAVTTLSFSEDGRTLVSASEDTTALVWKLWDTPGASAGALDRDAPWRALADEDARTAYAAMRRLAAVPKDAVALLRQRVTPVARPDEKRLAKLLADLDSQQFEVRDAAQAELAKVGETALPACRAALQAATSLELRRRLEGLMDQFAAETSKPSPERLRLLRSVEVLEMAGTAECRTLLQQLADGAPGAQLTEEAQTNLQRLARARRD
jgi:RNA polymerase sigma factor (sigma-70 family)